MNRPRGRPAKATSALSREAMLSGALGFLDAGGVAAFTMRALANHLGVTPMTIYHHFGDRSALIEAMADHAYVAVAAPAEGAGLDRIAALLLAYHAQVLAHPGLTLLIFSQQQVFPRQARRITDEITHLLIDAGLALAKTPLWVAILVDFTHGAAVATAMARGADPASADAGARDAYAEALRELLNGLQRLL